MRIYFRERKLTARSHYSRDSPNVVAPPRINPMESALAVKWEPETTYALKTD